MATRVVVIDNHDSFTYNLVQYFAILGATCEVRLSDRTTVEEIVALCPDGVVLSPGPGTPAEAGITLAVLSTLAGRIPILGVCLGHQAIGQTYGATLGRAPVLMHGKTSPIEHDGRTLFANLPSPFAATRYHSLILDAATLPECLEVSARTADGLVMGVRHRTLPVEGIQFHPESILTEHGLPLLQNWMRSL
ncbi:MAG TPA: aminodeoxychorismate/anthranilate synthase component II [Polyangiaceae bacterium]